VTTAVINGYFSLSRSTVARQRLVRLCGVFDMELETKWKQFYSRDGDWALRVFAEQTTSDAA